MKHKAKIVLTGLVMCGLLVVSKVNALIGLKELCSAYMGIKMAVGGTNSYLTDFQKNVIWDNMVDNLVRYWNLFSILHMDMADLSKKLKSLANTAQLIHGTGNKHILNVLLEEAQRSPYEKQPVWGPLKTPELLFDGIYKNLDVNISGNIAIERVKDAGIKDKNYAKVVACACGYGRKGDSNKNYANFARSVDWDMANRIKSDIENSQDLSVCDLDYLTKVLSGAQAAIYSTTGTMDRFLETPIFDKGEIIDGEKTYSGKEILENFETHCSPGPEMLARILYVLSCIRNDRDSGEIGTSLCQPERSGEYEEALQNLLLYLEVVRNKENETVKYKLFEDTDSVDEEVLNKVFEGNEEICEAAYPKFLSENVIMSYFIKKFGSEPDADGNTPLKRFYSEIIKLGLDNFSGGVSYRGENHEHSREEFDECFTYSDIAFELTASASKLSCQKVRGDYLGDGPFLTTCFPMPRNDVKGEKRYCYTGGCPASRINDLFLGDPVIKLMHNFDEDSSVFRMPKICFRSYPGCPIPSLFDRLWGPLSCSNFDIDMNDENGVRFSYHGNNPDWQCQLFPRLNQSQLDALGVK